MTFPSALSLILENKNTYLSRYVKRRHWWFIVELPLSPNTVYDDIKPSKHNPKETNLTVKFLDSLSTVHHPHHLVRTYTEENYIFGYIHYPNTNVSKWKAAFDLKIFPRCILAEANTTKLKCILSLYPAALSESAFRHLNNTLTSETYKAIQTSMGYAQGIDTDKLTTSISHWHIKTLQTRVKNSTIISIPINKKKTNNSHTPSREQKWEIIYNQLVRPTTR